VRLHGSRDIKAHQGSVTALLPPASDMLDRMLSLLLRSSRADRTCHRVRTGFD